tara:strand:- start:567 stop:677 length:111 start_codon:yes stop_codon:yes gene_type:complete
MFFTQNQDGHPKIDAPDGEDPLQKTPEEPPDKSIKR